MILRYDVLTVGSATLDTFLDTSMIAKPGDKILVNKIIKHSGGSATNSAAVLAKFGLKVKMLTKLGADLEGEFILKEMKNYKVKNICLHHSLKHSDVSTIINQDKDRTIYVHKGASTHLNINDYKKSQLNAKWFYIGSLMDNSFNVAKDLTCYAQEKKVKVLFNPSLYLASKGKNYLKPVLEKTNLLILNFEEAQALLKTKSVQPLNLLKQLQFLGPQSVIITDGKKKLYALDNNDYYELIPINVKIVHTAGAGDAFAATMLGAMIKGYNFVDSLKMAQINASSVIQHLGTKNKLLTEQQILKMVKKHKIKVNKK